MRKVALERLSKGVRSLVLRAIEEPVLVTEAGEPILVVRNVLEDDVADELIVRHPEFRASIERARKQKAAGQAKSLAEMRKKYSLE